jgi:hypothetical protein
MRSIKTKASMNKLDQAWKRYSGSSKGKNSITYTYFSYLEASLPWVSKPRKWSLCLSQTPLRYVRQVYR